MSSSQSSISLFSKFPHYSNLNSCSGSYSYTDSSYSYSSTVPSVFSIVIGIICLVVGIIYVFLGKRHIRFCTIFTGFIIFATITFLVFVLAFDSYHFSYSNMTYVTVFIGIIGATIFGCFLKAGIVLIGFCFGANIWAIYVAIFIGIICATIFDYFLKAGIVLIGFCFGANIWAMIFYFSQSSSIGLYIGFTLAFGIAFAILTLFKMDKMVVVGTAFLGSQIFMQGVSYLSLVGYFVTIENGSYRNYSAVAFWGMFIGSLVLWGIGITFQFYKYGGYPYLDSFKRKKDIQSQV